MDVNVEDMKRKIKRYYEEFFDPSPLITLLNGHPFKFREFGYESFEYDPNKNRYVIRRNMNFANPFAMVDWAVSHVPRKLYMGAQFSDILHGSVQHATWVGNDLKFDIDLDDFDGVRKDLCGCQGKTMCPMCFELVKEAVVFLIDTLDEDFANYKFPCYRDNAVIFISGSKGMHVHYPVIYKLAPNGDRKKEEETRRFIIDYMQMISEIVIKKENEEKEIKMKLLHTKFKSTQLERRFYEMIVKWFIMKNPVEYFLDMEWKGIKKGKRSGGSKKLSKKATEEIFVQLKSDLSEHPEIKVTKQLIESYGIFAESMFMNAIHYRYPRYDGPITYDVNRLIKVPNSVDGSTGMIVQRVDYDHIWDLKLSDLLTVDHFV